MVDLNEIVKNITLEEFSSFDGEYDSVACFDENGASSAFYKIFECISKGLPVDENIRYFTLTCCLFSKKDYLFSKDIIAKLKRQYFKKETEPVVLHTRDIKKRNKPFNLIDKKYGRFISSLSTVIDLIRCKIISVTFDLVSYVNQSYKYDPYEVAIDIILQVMLKNIKKNQKVALVFESRGKNEDKELYKHLYKILHITGIKNTSFSVIKSHFNQVFFNRKLSSSGEFAYPGIEMADLCSYPIHRYVRFNREAEDYLIVKKKLIGYYEGANSIAGLRKFPKNWQK